MTRLAMICDFPQEGWHSMDLYAGQLIDSVRRLPVGSFRAEKIAPDMVRLASRYDGRRFWNFDRLVNRHLRYPLALRGLTSRFDIFHVLDHSYAHLLHSLPAERTVVTCHDIDAFRSILEPESEPRPWWYRSIARRILSGLRRAAHVCCVSEATRQDLLRHRVVPPERTSVVYNGVAPVFRPSSRAAGDADLKTLLGPPGESLELLHVGSTIPRKRIEFLLRIVAELRRRDPRIRLLRVGGPLLPAQAHVARELGLQGSIVTLPYLDDPTLAALYRRVPLCLQTSSAEGFGLPVAEALACGCSVVASDLPALREVGGDSAHYCSVGQLDEWTARIAQLLRLYAAEPEQWRALQLQNTAQGSRFRWEDTARQTTGIYRRLAAK